MWRRARFPLPPESAHIPATLEERVMPANPADHYCEAEVNPQLGQWRRHLGWPWPKGSYVYVAASLVARDPRAAAMLLRGACAGLPPDWRRGATTGAG